MAYYPNDILTPHFITGAIEKRPTRASMKQRYIGLSLLPLKQVPTRRLTWDVVASENNLAGFYGPKGEPVAGDDLMFSSAFADVIDIMAMRDLDQEIVDSVRAPGMPAVFAEGGSAFPVQNIRRRFEDHVNKAVGWCDDAVDAQVEYMIMQALTGSMVWPPVTAAGATITPPMPHWNADQAMTVTFPLYATFIQNASTLSGHGSRAGGGYAWTNASADPIKDLEVIAQFMVEEKGIDADNMRIIMSRSTLSYLAFNTNILNWIRGKDYEAPGGYFVEIPRLKEFIKTRLGYTVETYDAQWTYRSNIAGAPPTINRVKFLKEHKVLIIPTAEAGELGYTANCWHKDGEGNFKYDKYAWVKEEDEPPFGTRVGIGMVAFPILEQAESVFVLTANA